MNVDEQVLRQRLDTLESGPCYHFHDWPNEEVPKVAAGVYTIWRDAAFIYVGMSGKKLTEETIAQLRARGSKIKGLSVRLASHAAGGRGGDKFCLYVCDRFVLNTLDAAEIAMIAEGTLSLDRITREYIHANCSYRFIVVENGTVADKLETQIREGALSSGRPVLHPKG